MAVVLARFGNRTGGEALAVLAVTFCLGCLLDLAGVLEEDSRGAGRVNFVVVALLFDFFVEGAAEDGARKS